MNWIVIIGSGAWAKCYGLFASYDAAVEWARLNQFEADDTHIYPVNGAT
jgi:hypothetical protein